MGQSATDVQRWVCRAAAFLVILATVIITPAASGRDSAHALSQYRQLQFNTAGNALYRGSNKAAYDIGNLIYSVKPHVATINEICLHQAALLDSYIYPVWPMTVIHKQTIPTFYVDGVECKYGNAVLAYGKGSVPNPNSSIALYSAGVEQRVITCIDAYVPVGIRSCVTHLEPVSNSVRTIQLSQVRDFVQPHINAGYGVHLGGDFNVTPYGGDTQNPRILDRIYYAGWGGYGSFKEVEGSRNYYDPTFQSSKIDYFFVDKTHWYYLSATTVSVGQSPPVSDHKALRGYAYH